MNPVEQMVADRSENGVTLTGPEYAELREGVRSLVAASKRAFSNGQDAMAADILQLVTAMTENESSCDDLLEAIIDTCTMRIELGLPESEWT